MEAARVFATVLVGSSLLFLPACGDETTQAACLPAATAIPTPTATPTATPITPPAVPTSVQVPAGNTPFRVGHATGTQDYICLPTATGFAWTFFGPQATLLDDDDAQIITHFLSANPEEGGTARATWQDSRDTSTVWAKRIGSADHTSDPDVVAADAIPWFLLQVVGSQSGPTGGQTLTSTTYIQRLNTSGGVAPSAGCAQSTDVSKMALVPYTANYFFYKAGS